MEGIALWSELGSEEEGGRIKMIKVYLGVDCDILSCSFAHHQCYNTWPCCLRLVLFPGSLLKDMGREVGNKASLKMGKLLHFTVTHCLYIPTGDRVSYNASLCVVRSYENTQNPTGTLQRYNVMSHRHLQGKPLN